MGTNFLFTNYPERSNCISRANMRYDAGETIVEYSLQLSQDLISQLLGFGDKVEVLEPASLRKEMKNIIKSMFNNYKK